MKRGGRVNGRMKSFLDALDLPSGVSEPQVAQSLGLVRLNPRYHSDINIPECQLPGWCLIPFPSVVDNRLEMSVAPDTSLNKG